MALLFVRQFVRSVELFGAMDQCCVWMKKNEA